MWTTAKIRRHILRIADDKPFSIRDFLAYGSRSAVDQAVRRLVMNGEIIRVARGLFIKPRAPKPSILDVAIAKAKAFKKTIATHGSSAARILKIADNSNQEYLFACSGHSSSFRYGKIVIRFIGTSARQMHLGNEPVGLVIRALWYLRKEICDIHTASQAVRSFGRIERQQLRESLDIMPDWMKCCFATLLSRGSPVLLGARG
jgi:hypothetical protein